MDGVGGYQGWRWIFILEGVATVIVAAVSFWMLHDYPSTAKFLSAPERALMMQRLKLDGDGCSNEYKNKFIWQSIMDWKTWASCLMFHFCLMPVYSFSLFSPTLTANLGYSAANAQLLSVPPYVLAAITTILAGYLSDKYQQRGIFVMALSLVGTLGYLMNLVTNIPGVNYTGLFLAAAGMYPQIPLVVSWGANNSGGSLKRGITTALIVSVGNAGGIISAFTFPATDKPRYYKGHAINTAYCFMTFVTGLVMYFYYKRENARREQIMAAHGPYTAEEKAALSEEGDAVPWFKYVY